MVHPKTISYFQVQKSMKNIDLVVREREIALRLLQTGHEKPVPGEWRNDFLGRTYWYGKDYFPFAHSKFSHDIFLGQKKMHILHRSMFASCIHMMLYLLLICCNWC